MADTLGAMIIRILRRTGQNPSKTTLADTDDTQWLADRINEALQYIYGLKPFYVDNNGTISLTASTRLYNGPSSTDLDNIEKWSMRLDQTGGDIFLNFITREALINMFPNYESESATYPERFYIEGTQIGFHPIPTGSLTAQFIYTTQFTRLTTWSATFPFSDESDETRYCEKFAQFAYEDSKGLGLLDVTQDEMQTYKGLIKVKYAKAKRQGFTGYRRFS